MAPKPHPVTPQMSQEPPEPRPGRIRPPEGRLGVKPRPSPTPGLEPPSVAYTPGNDPLERWGVVRVRVREAIRGVEEARDSSRGLVGRLRDATDHARSISTAKQIISLVLESKRAEVRTSVEDVVSRCLTHVFGPPTSFRFADVTTRGQVGFIPTVVYGDIERSLSEVGGGVLDIVSFGFRLAILLLKPHTRPILILDEPFRHLSKELHPRASELVAHIARASGIQVIVVSHEPDIATNADRVITIAKTGTISTLEVQ